MELEFKRLHDGCSHEDLFKLMDIDCLRNMVYIFNGATRSVAHPTGNEVPWTVLLLLGGYNRKHRFCSRRNPDLVQFSRDVSNIEQLVLRAWGIFINDKDQGPASVPPEVRATARDMQRKLVDSAAVAVMGTAGRHRWFCNESRAVQHARRWLQQSEYRVIKTDKDGGFGLILEDDLHRLLQEKLIPPHYTEVAWAGIPRESILRAFCSAARRLGGLLKDPSLTRRLLQVTTERHDVISNIQYTLKTHKPPRKVALRVIHACNRHPGKGLGRFVAQALRPKIKEAEHICFSTEDFLKRIKSARVDKGDWMVKMDIDNFYMEGSHEELAVKTTKHIQPREVREELRNIIQTLLHYQYVECKTMGTVYQVTRGSGMGSNSSADIADMMFKVLAEDDWAASQEVKHRHGVKAYFRYRDDIYILIKPDSLALAGYIKGIMDRTRGTYVVKIEALCVNDCPYLDVEMYIQNGVLEYRAFFKPTLQQCPLHFSSAHAPGVHWWPLAEVLRVSRRCSTSVDFEAAKSVLLRRYKAQSMAWQVVEAAAKLNPFAAKPTNKFFTDTVVPREQRRQGTWWVAGFHPVWYNARVGAVIKQVLQRWSTEGVLQQWHPQIGVAWRNIIPSMADVVIKY